MKFIIGFICGIALASYILVEVRADNTKTRKLAYDEWECTGWSGSPEVPGTCSEYTKVKGISKEP